MDPTLTTVLVCTLVLAISVIQRVAGSGFGLIMAPFLVVLLGPHEGVMLVNFLSLFPPLFIMGELWRYIEWRKFLWLTAWAVLMVPLGAMVTARSSPGLLSIAVGLMVLLGLVISLHFARSNRRIDGCLVQAVAGAGAGLGTVLVGVGAPPLAIYTVVSRWPLRSMIATVQPLWFVISGVSFGSKWLFDEGQLPSLPWWGWAGAVLVIPVGIWAGQQAERILAKTVVQRVVVLLAVLGAVMALMTGVDHLRS